MIAALPSSLLLAIPLAVVAGFISFASPCVLPLVPGYVAFLGGALNQPGERARARALFGTGSFILGFACVFVSEGALFGELGHRLAAHERVVAIVLGSITILLGLLFAGWAPSRLTREWRFHALPAATVVGAFALGVLFGVGWTPCIGPTLSAILGLVASTRGATAARGSILAFFYCLGLGVPFVVFALAGGWATRASRFMRRHQRTLSAVGGLLLVVIGVLEVSGLWQQWVVWLQVHAPSVSMPL